MSAKIGIVGAGNMARSLVGGLVDAGYSSENICVTSPTQAKLDAFQSAFGVMTDTVNEVAVRGCDVVLFAVKPNVLATVVQELANAIQEHSPLVISIAAGVRALKIQEWVGSSTAIVRCMPNTPAMLQCGATALFSNAQVSVAQKELAESILRAVGVTLWLEDEDQLDAVTALSGSGPAYFFLVIEAMKKAAISLGLDDSDANLLTLQTALGAARMALESSQDVHELREQVTSRGGTTERALQVLEAGDLSGLFADAITQAAERAKELSQ